MYDGDAGGNTATGRRLAGSGQNRPDLPTSTLPFCGVIWDHTTHDIMVYLIRPLIGSLTTQPGHEDGVACN